MKEALIERSLAFVFSIVVGGTAAAQLKNELPVPGIDAAVTKLLLALMIVGCVLAFLASVGVLGVFPGAHE